MVFVWPDEDDRPHRRRPGLAVPAGNPNILTTRSMAPVTPAPQKTTTSSALPLTEPWMMPRACSRSSVVRLPVAVASVWVLAYMRQNVVADEVLDEAQRAAGGGVVGVDETATPEGPVQQCVVADHPAPDPARSAQLWTSPGLLRGGMPRLQKDARARPGIPCAAG